MIETMTKMKFMKRLGVAFVLLTVLTGMVSGAEPSQFTWNCGKYGSIAEQDGRKILTVRVPEAAKDATNCATVDLDLVPYRGSLLGLRVKARGRGISIPKHNFNGVKFMLHYVDGAGLGRWYNISGVKGTFDWQEFSFNAPITQDATRGVLSLGLQESFGEVEFDLSSLTINSLHQAKHNDFRVSYPEKIRKTPPLRGVMSPSKDFQEDDFKTLHDWKVNLVRAQLTKSGSWGNAGTDRDLAVYDAWLNGRLDHFEKMFQFAYENYGIRFVIDLHSPPGGRSQVGELAIFHEEKYMRHFLEVWKRIATRFKGNPAVWGYDLVNEPAQTLPARYDYRTIQRMAAEEVRKIDPDTPIIFAANEWSNPNAFQYLEPLEMDNVIYQVHMYVPGGFTHQLVGNNFGEKGDANKMVYPGDRYNKEFLRKTLQPVLDFQKKHNARIYVGEFGAVIWAPGADRYLADCIALFEEYQWDWTYHAFREWYGWSLEHEGELPNQVRPSADNPRKQVLLDGFRQNEVK